MESADKMANSMASFYTYVGFTWWLGLTYIIFSSIDISTRNGYPPQSWSDGELVRSDRISQT